uniref:Cytochrome c oxidase subunit 6A1, mitochondrial n=2 Tax=Cacopsylla melanoneura TaxID=428564 RepID=A0A8D9AGM9_9HEMI
MFRLRSLINAFKCPRIVQYHTKASQPFPPLQQTKQQTSSVTQLQVMFTQSKVIESFNPVRSSYKPWITWFSWERPALFHTRPYYYKKEEQDECECYEDSDEPSSDHGTKIWRILTLYVCLPGILLGSFLIWRHETEGHHERPEFIPYDYLRIRNRPFPWGDGNHSLFHNKCQNALPDGYEDEEEEACKTKSK